MTLFDIPEVQRLLLEPEIGFFQENEYVADGRNKGFKFEGEVYLCRCGNYRILPIYVGLHTSLNDFLCSQSISSLIIFAMTSCPVCREILGL
jgi:hypothetical protein